MAGVKQVSMAIDEANAMIRNAVDGNDVKMVSRQQQQHQQSIPTTHTSGVDSQLTQHGSGVVDSSMGNRRR